MTSSIFRESWHIIECTEANKNRQQINISLMDETPQGVWEMMFWYYALKTAA